MRYFKTKKEKKDYFRELLYQVEEGKPLKGDEDEELRDLFTYADKSQEIDRNSIDFFFVRTHSAKGWKPTKCFYFKLHTGEEDHFSFIKAIDGPSIMSYLVKAGRYLVTDQTLTFKQSKFNGYEVFIENPDTPREKVFIWDKSHVDHKHPNTFSKLINGWMAWRGLEPGDIKLVDVKDSLHTTFEDSWLAEDWSKFHKKNAQLRLLSAKDNMRLGKRAEKKETP